MRLSRRGVGIRGMMLAVAVGALALWCGQVGWRWLRYSQVAEVHERASRALRSGTATTQFYVDILRSKGEPVPAEMTAVIRDRESSLKAQLELARKYREAASHPWRRLELAD